MTSNYHFPWIKTWILNANGNPSPKKNAWNRHHSVNSKGIWDTCYHTSIRQMDTPQEWNYRSISRPQTRMLNSSHPSLKSNVWLLIWYYRLHICSHNCLQNWSGNILKDSHQPRIEMILQIESIWHGMGNVNTEAWEPIKEKHSLWTALFLFTMGPTVGMWIISAITHILSASRCGPFPVDYTLVIILSGWVYVSHSVMSDSLGPHVACQAPPSMEFSRQEYWSGLPFPSPIWVGAEL